MNPTPLPPPPSASPKINLYSEVEILRLQPGDTVVVYCSTRLAAKVYERVLSTVKEHFPKHDVVVCDGGVRLGVVRKEENQDMPRGDRDET